MKKITTLIALFLIFFSSLNANAFDLIVTPTNETCPGVGSLAFQVSGHNTSATMTYNIYLLPNTTTPVASTTQSSHGGLVAGNYLVVASQTVNGVVVTAQQNAVILNQLNPLSYNITSTNVRCGTDGQIVVNVTSGNPVSYQILSGPVTTGLQSSNIFSNLPVGNYVIRVFDNCGDGIPLSYTLASTPTTFTIDTGVALGGVLPNCNSTFVNHNIIPANGAQIAYPLNVVITTFLPGGATNVTNQTITSGSNLSAQISLATNDITYPYNIVITDLCGNQTSLNNNTVNAEFDFAVNVQLTGCNDYYVTFIPTNYVPNYTVNFTSFPAGFVPSNFNSTHPGPFSSSDVTYGGAGNPLPLGDYTVQLTDSCGNTKTKSFTIQVTPPTPTHISSVIGCTGLGNFGVSLTPSIALATATIIAAPSAYTPTLPSDVSSFISGGQLAMSNVPVGNYTLNLTDVCGNSYLNYVVTFPPPTPETPSIDDKPGCDFGLSSVKISFPTSKVTVVEIVEAPTSFTFPLPYIVSFNINAAGSFYMNSLPAGDYKFRVESNCGYNGVINRTLTGYSVTSTTINDPVETCGAFNLMFQHISNGTYISSYWLQKYNATDDVWEHPVTGADYLSNSFPSTTNSISLQNNLLNLNIQASGQFRILKVFLNYSNGSSSLNRCVSEIGQFVFNGGPKITNAYAFPCTNGTQEVVIIAQGLPPLQYRIVEKDGNPFVVNNGTNNSFTGLAPGLYKFQVEDGCGTILNRTFDVSLLPSPSISPTDLCPGQNGKLEVQAFSFVNYQWYKQSSPSVILSTTNFLNLNNFNPLTDAGIYVVQLSTTNASSCVNQMIQYEIKASDYTPKAGSNAIQSYCKESQTINLNSLLSSPHDAGGVWTDSTGNILTSTTINPIDLTNPTNVYTYTVTSVLCSITDDATVTINIKELPIAPTLSQPSTICRGNDVQLTATSIAGASYFWSGPNGFTSTLQNPTITNFSSANDGDYFAYVTVNGCNSATNQIAVTSNPIPAFAIDGETQFCLSQSEVLSVNPTNFSLTGATYQWYLDNVSISTGTNSTLDVNEFGTYKVEVNVGGCLNTEEVIVSEKVDAFQVNLSQGCFGNNYFVNITNESDFPGATYDWTGPNGFTSFQPSINVTNSGVGDYQVIVTNAEGCKETASINVPRVTCFIPNGLSPNDDGDNDNLNLAGYNVKKLSIYNRYGRLVYEQENYIDQWKGQSFDGKLLPATTYFYVIDYETEGENRKTGWIYISY